MSNNSNEQIRILSEILKWIRFTGIREVKSTLKEMLDSDMKKFIYQKSDGSIGTVELAKLAGSGSNKTVADMWDNWLRVGLGENVPVRGGSRFRRSFDLEEFGIKIPEIKTKQSSQENKEETADQKPEAQK